MAKKQTRRSLSIEGTLFHRLKEHCAQQNISVSGFMEELIHKKLDELETRQKPASN